MSWIIIVALLLSLLLLLFALAVLSSFGFTLFLGSPWVPTYPLRAKRMLEFAELKPGESIADLGCGDGAILISAVENFGVQRAIGYDINPVVLLMGKLKIRARGLQHRITLSRKNIFTSDVPQVDVIATFLIPNTMKKMQEKLGRELPPTTRIISRGFQFPDAKPYKQMETDEGWFYLYRAGDLYAATHK